jgi:hypothetical protein
LAELLERLQGSRVDREVLSGGPADDIEARFLHAAAQLQEIAELEPERKRAVERFNSEATEENWREAERLIAPRSSRSE